MNLRQAALERARGLVARAIDVTAPPHSARVHAMQACHLLAGHGLLADIGERLALEETIEALIGLLEILVRGCEHSDGGVCSACTDAAALAIVEARRSFRARGWTPDDPKRAAVRGPISAPIQKNETIL